MPCLFIAIGQSTLQLLDGESGFELPLERTDTGELTPACKQHLIGRLQEHVKGKAWGWRPRALCALGARGVSLRHLAVPRASHEELKRVLELQLESEFPLPPDQLAWGYCRLNGRNGGGRNGADGQQLLVAAVK